MRTTTPDIIEDIIALRESKDWAFAKIARHLSAKYDIDLTKDRVQKIYRNRQQKVPTSLSEYEWKETEPSEADYKWENTEPSATLTPPWPGPERRKVVVTADWHGRPDVELLNMIIAEQPDIIVLAGDLLDSNYFADHPWNANQPNVNYDDESMGVRHGVKRFVDETSALIVIIHGNHDVKLQKVIARQSKMALSFIKDPLEEVVKGLERVEIAKLEMMAVQPRGLQVTDMGQSQYMVMVGDALISHGNFVGKNPGDASAKLRGWLNDWRRYLNMGEIALTVQAHTHKLYYAEHEGGWLVQVYENRPFGRQILRVEIRVRRAYRPRVGRG